MSLDHMGPRDPRASEADAPAAGPPAVIPRDSHDRQRTAYHEAGHALAAWLYDRPLAVVSIKPGRHYNGVTRFESADRGWIEAFDVDSAALFQPIDVRTAIEREIVISLAGPIAAELALPPTGFTGPDECELVAERESASMAALSPRAQELVTAMESGPPHESDEQTAAHLSHALTWDEAEAAAHLAWLRVTARRLIARHWYRAAALAAALLERPVLDGKTAVAILTAAHKGEHVNG